LTKPKSNVFCDELVEHRNSPSAVWPVRQAVGYLDDKVRAEADVAERGEELVEGAGAEVHQRVGGEQGRRDGRPGGPSAAVLEEHL
jgi:hypothetical protein